MACLLVLGLDGDDPYRGVTWIEVQPTTMVSRGPRRVRRLAAWSPTPSCAILGETSFTGPVFIAWDAARDGARHPERGHNVVYHEFAHKLDMDDGTVDGTPVLGPVRAPAVDRGVHRRLRGGPRRAWPASCWIPMPA